MAKTATFGILHLGTSFGVGYLLTGSLGLAGAITLVEPLVNTVMHYFFDKGWEHPRWQAWLRRDRRPAPERARAPVAATA